MKSVRERGRGIHSRHQKKGSRVGERSTSDQSGLWLLSGAVLWQTVHVFQPSVSTLNRNGFRSPLKVFFAELELRHCLAAHHGDGLPRL